MPKNQAVLFLGNHQNALLDALLIATKSGRTSYFLTRAGVFKNPMVSRLLKSLNMLPVYRVRDGWSTVTKNKSVFSNTVALLHNNEAIAIFPEGNHNLARRVRALSKGFTRIVIEHRSKHPEQVVNLIPVGLNYNAPKSMGSCVAIYFAKAIPSTNYNHLTDVDATNQIKADVFNIMSRLTTQIPEVNYDQVLEKLIALNVDFTNPEEVNQCIASNFENCITKIDTKSLIKSILKPVVYFVLFLPIIVWRQLIIPKIKEDEFLSTFRFAVCITLVPLWLLIVFVIGCLAVGVLSSILSLLIIIILLIAYNKA